jgi:RHS repeat-associated protein
MILRTRHNYTYQAFGTLETTNGGTKNDYLFAGEQNDKVLDKYYLRQRFYDQSSGRFSRRDSWQSSLNNPLALHKYAYAGSNPVNSIDPTGLFTIAEISTANAIRDTLAGIKAVSEGYLISAATKEGDYGLKEFLIDTAWNALFALVPIVAPHIARRLSGSRHSLPPLGARGPISGRDFDPANAGGPIRALVTRKVKITHSGVDKVTAHVRRFQYDPGNEYMIDRLRKVADGSTPPTQVDLNYYTHELREGFRYKRLGVPSGQEPLNADEARIIWNNAHTATLEDYGLRDIDLLHPEAIKLSEEYLRRLYGL